LNGDPLRATPNSAKKLFPFFQMEKTYSLLPRRSSPSANHHGFRVPLGEPVQCGQHIRPSQFSKNNPQVVPPSSHPAESFRPSSARPNNQTPPPPPTPKNPPWPLFVRFSSPSPPVAFTSSCEPVASSCATYFLTPSKASVIRPCLLTLEHCPPPPPPLLKQPDASHN